MNLKSYTNIEQAKKLAEILPLESADMFYNEEQDETYPKSTVDTEYPMVMREGQKHYLEEYGIPCWSLAALLDVLPKIVNTQTLFIETSAALWHIGYRDVYIARSENPVDACIDMIIRLNELKML